jgi:hypothetical protein
VGVIIARGTATAGGSGTGAYTNVEKLAMELEMGFKAASLDNYKELTYSNGSLSNIGIWVDDTKVTQIFDKDLTYDVGDNLSRTELTRISDSSTLTKIFSYDVEDNLFSITASGG